MKKQILFSISSLLFATIIFIGCKKNDGATKIELTRVPTPLVTKDPTGDANISGQDPGSFVGKFIVDLYFKTDKVQKFDVVVIKNGNKANVKTIQANVTAFPSPMQVTGTQLTTLFGTAPVAGDNFQIGVDITTLNGLKMEAFPVVGNAYASGISAQPGGSPSITYLTLCSFDKASFNGNYTVAQDDWADFEIGDPVEVKPGAGANQISITAYPSPTYGNARQPMIVDVDPATFAVTIPQQVIGNYFGAPPGATVRGTGVVNPCGDNITLTLTINIGGTDYEDLVLSLNK